MRMRFVRNNDDSALLEDLERLAGRGSAIEVAPAGAEPGDPVAADDPVDDAADPLDDPFVLGFVRASVHLKRYAPFYLGAAAWAATMLLIQPLGAGDGRPDGPGFAGTTARAVPAAVSSSTGADAIAAPSFLPVAGASFAPTPTFDGFGGSEFGGGAAFDDDVAFPAADEGSGDFSGSPESSGDTTFDFGDNTTADRPSPLAITRSGYASATGGTPAEQDPPGGGLPIAAALGNDTKRSFVELSGDATMLRLRQARSGAVQPESAVIKACPLVSADWKAQRGQPLNGSPTFESACSTGTITDGVWTFDLGLFAPQDLAKGLALTPGAGTALTFEVVLEPVALEPEAPPGG